MGDDVRLAISLNEEERTACRIGADHVCRACNVPALLLSLGVVALTIAEIIFYRKRALTSTLLLFSNTMKTSASFVMTVSLFSIFFENVIDAPIAGALL